jgi:alpha-methylacyl-CoA racemase
MVDGASLLMTFIYGFLNGSRWQDRRQSNLLDGGAPYYDTYECADGGWVSLGAIEPQFWAEFVRIMQLDGLPDQLDRGRWPELRGRIAARFRERTREEWAELFAGSAACVAPVLSMTEAPHDPHLQARGTFVEHAGAVQPSVAPRFSRTPGELGTPPAASGENTREALLAWGFDQDEITKLESTGTVVQTPIS